MKIHYLKQIQELPFNREDSLWIVEINDMGEIEKLTINGVNMTHCSPRLWDGLILYYMDEDLKDIQIEKDNEWFKELVEK